MGFSPTSYTGTNWRRLFPPAIRTLIVACTAVLLLEELLDAFGGVKAGSWFLHWFGLVPYAVTHGLRIWQPFTYLFLHGGILHLVLNMLFLWMFGADLERMWGSRKFYRYYFLCGIGAGIITVLVKTAVDFSGTGSSLIPTIGASGAIYGIILAAALAFPNRQVWIFPFPITIPLSIFAIAAGVIEFLSSLSPGGDSVAHVCHLGGMLVGYLYLRRGSFLYSFRNRYSDWQKKRLQRKFEVYQRSRRDEPPSRPDNWVN